MKRFGIFIMILLVASILTIEKANATIPYVFIAVDPVSHKAELFVDNRPTGGSILKLNGPLVANGHVLNFIVSEDGTRVIYSADARFYSMYELFSVAITGGTVYRISHTLPPDYDVFDYKVSPDGLNVVYRWGRTAIGGSTLYATKSIPTDVPIQLSIPLTLGGGIESYKISCDSKYVFYVADAFIDEQFENFYVQMNGDGHIHLPQGGHYPGDFCIYQDGFASHNAERWH